MDVFCFPKQMISFKIFPGCGCWTKNLCKHCPPPKKNPLISFKSETNLKNLEQGFRLASLLLLVLSYYVTFSFLPTPTWSDTETSLTFIFIVLIFNVTTLTFQSSKPLYLENSLSARFWAQRNLCTTQQANHSLSPCTTVFFLITFTTTFYIYFIHYLYLI